MSRPSLLFIRSVPAAAAMPALAWLRENTGPVHITALTSAAAARELRDAGVVDACEITNAPRLSVFALRMSELRRLACRRDEMVIVPYLGDRQRFWNVAWMALALGGATTMWLPCDRLPPRGDPRAVLKAVSPLDWWRQASVATRARRLLLGAIKWPALVIGYVLGMTALTALAAILLPLVWLAPKSDAHES